MNTRRLLRFDEVVLVRLHEGLHKLGWNQPDIVPLLVQRPAEEVSPGARLHADQRALHVRGISQQLLLRELLPHKHRAGADHLINSVRRRGSSPAYFRVIDILGGARAEFRIAKSHQACQFALSISKKQSMDHNFSGISSG